MPVTSLNHERSATLQKEFALFRETLGRSVDDLDDINSLKDYFSVVCSTINSHLPIRRIDRQFDPKLHQIIVNNGMAYFKFHSPDTATKRDFDVLDK